tara:strand:+ start:219 stop:968 length:750 start_codon:yes stop_codon:yes gene_type:complete
MVNITNKHIHIVTYATHSEGTFDELINNEFNVKIDVLGFGEKWENFMQSMLAFYEFMKQKNDDDIIVLLDAFDVCLNSSTNNLIERFENMNTKILVSKDTNSYFTRKIFGICRDGYIANTGMIMGYNKYLKSFFDKMINTVETTDDQREFNRTCNLVDFEVKVDSNEIIFRNVPHKQRSPTGGRIQNYKGTENFLGFPGQHTVKRTLRGIKEYCPFFKVEITILLVILIFGIAYIHLKNSDKNINSNNE